MDPTLYFTVILANVRTHLDYKNIAKALQIMTDPELVGLPEVWVNDVLGLVTEIQEAGSKPIFPPAPFHCTLNPIMKFLQTDL